MLAVSAGAFGAHGLRSRVSPEMLAVFETGARYHLTHALGLIAVAWLASWRGAAADTAGWLLSAGILLFSGSLYLLAVSGIRAFGVVTPFGGLAFLAGWAAFAWLAATNGR